MILTRAWADGSCAKGIGGWAVVIVWPDETFHTDTGGEVDTTIGRMELQAAIRAAEGIHGHLGRITCDARYVTDNIIDPYHRFSVMRAHDIINLDLWRRLHELNDLGNLTWRWVKGHAGDRMNDAVDKLATRARADVERAYRHEAGQDTGVS